MSKLPGVHDELCDFVFEESRIEADNILQNKDPPTNSFNLDTLEKFSYKEQFNRFKNITPLLLACILGTLSKSKGEIPSEISRKSFGGQNKGEELDLIPTVVQFVSRILLNRHPRCVSIIPCLNSLFCGHVKSPAMSSNYSIYLAIRSGTGMIQKGGISTLRGGWRLIRPIFH